MNALSQATDIVRDAVEKTRSAGLNGGLLGSGPLKVTIETNAGTVVPNVMVWDRMADQVREHGIGACIRLDDGLGGGIAGRILEIA